MYITPLGFLVLGLCWAQLIPLCEAFLDTRVFTFVQCFHIAGFGHGSILSLL